MPKQTISNRIYDGDTLIHLRPTEMLKHPPMDLIPRAPLRKRKCFEQVLSCSKTGMFRIAKQKFFATTDLLFLVKIFLLISHDFYEKVLSQGIFDFAIG